MRQVALTVTVLGLPRLVARFGNNAVHRTTLAVLALALPALFLLPADSPFFLLTYVHDVCVRL